MKFEAIKRPKGVNDILTSETAVWRKIEETAEKIFSLYGYKEIRPPIFEKSELFSRGIGEGTDVVEKEMYSFKDRGKRLFTLRPEGTASVVRLFIENKLYSERPVNKLYYIGPMFRAERPQAGRYRQFHQIGVEIFGPDSPWMDAEAIYMLYNFFEELEVKNNVIELNSVGCAKCRGPYQDKLRTFLTQNKESLCEECEKRKDKNPLRAFDCKHPDCKNIMFNAPLLPSEICEECHKHFQQTLEAIDSYGVKYKKNPLLVRGLDYYTKTAFEIVNSTLGAQNAIAGGGRYDGLVKLLGGPDIKGFGFALGVERLKMVLDATKKAELKKERTVFVLLLCDGAIPSAIKISKELRSKGIITEMSSEIKSLKSQMKRAGKDGADFVIILGEEELLKKEAIVRNMSSSSQENIAFEKISEYFSK